MNSKKVRVIIKATLDMLPLSLAVMPWGVLVGSLAMQQNFSPVDAQLLSLLVFAGAAQLVAIELIGQNASLLTLMLTIFVISSRHFLYGLALREKLKKLPNKQRLASGFVLTDELFALSGHEKSFTSPLHILYGLAAGFSFYIAWNLWTFIGIIAGQYLPDLTELGLDFAIAVTFIALVIPSIKSRSILIAVVVTAIASVVLTYYQFELALIFATALGMVSGYWASFFDETNNAVHGDNT